jgi:uncharacterized protein (TIGR02300 family)
MTKPELGAKRLCVRCGAKFYDLHHTPINCPKCDAVFEPMQLSTRWRAEAARKPVGKVEPVVAETEDARSASPEDADAVAQGKQKPGEASEAGDEAEVVDDENLDDAAFIEEKEDTDVTEIIGGDIEIEKGT